MKNNLSTVSVIFVALGFLLLLGCKQQSSLTQKDRSATKISSERSAKVDNPKKQRADKVIKTEAEWRAELSDQEYYVTREAGTERAFTGPFWDNKAKGTYTCRCCSLPLFESETKFKSGTGWPSFYAPINETDVGEIVDNKYGMQRIEVVCDRCDAHLGHVFNDGPPPTGLRYCINGTSLQFDKK